MSLSSSRVSRREAVAAFAWFPFFRRRSVSLAGARFEIRRHGRERNHYFWVHGNETTAGELLREHLRAVPGKGVLTTSPERHITVHGAQLDPNRMFSRVGAEKSLRSLNPTWTDEQLTKLLDRLDRDRPRLVNQLRPQPGARLVALHNNGPGYAVTDEVPISDMVSLQNAGNPHEFMLCTSPADYAVLAQSPFNVVLQNKVPPEDDGSLSRLAAREGFRYINIEAGLGKRDAQQQMLQWLETHLP